MSESKKNSPVPKSAPFEVEDQSQRRIKYGANVLLTVAVVIVLAGAAVYIAGRVNWRKDTTSGGNYSLKPQTVRLVQNLPQKVRIVGLFTKAQKEQETKVKDDSSEVRYQQVSDLLQEYQQKSNGKISVEMIDRVTEPSKIDNLFNEVARKYGNDYKKYQEVMDAYGPTLDQINKVATQEIDALKKSAPKITDQKMAMTIGEVVVTVQYFPQLLDDIRRNVKKQTDLKVPDYKGAADDIRSGLEGLNERVDAVLKRFKETMADPKTPKDFKDYIASAEPRYNEMKKAADDLLKKISGLGELKQLDELRQNKADDCIAVLGENDLKVLPKSAIYTVDDNARVIDSDSKLKPRFAGEQRISMALVTLTSTNKPRIVFVRSGGPPAATSIPMVGYQARYSDMAERFRDYGLEVLDKDISGQWQMQAMQLQMQMQGMPLPPEATDEKMKNAVWIVLVTPQDPRQLMQNPSAGMLGPKVNEHLKAGGSAMILVDVQTEKMDFLKDWGIETKPEYILVHDKVDSQGARSEDIAMDWQRQQPVFITNEYGDHAITRPLNSLDGLLVPVIPVSTVAAKGVKTTPILPIPATPKVWAESDIESVGQGKPVTFDPKKEGTPDLAGPFWGGAVAEKENGKGRLVVIGCSSFPTDSYIRIANVPVSKAQDRLVARFPANPELFTNAVFWLTKMDTMIAISPSAMEIPRVAPMGTVSSNLLRFVLPVIVLPALVLIAGLSVYFKRRD